MKRMCQAKRSLLAGLVLGAFAGWASAPAPAPAPCGTSLEHLFNDPLLMDGRIGEAAVYAFHGKGVVLEFAYREPTRIGGVRITSPRSWVNCCVKRASFYARTDASPERDVPLREHVAFRPANTFKEIWTTWKPVVARRVKMVIEETWDHQRNYYDWYPVRAQTMIPSMFGGPLWDVYADDTKLLEKGTTVQIAEMSFFGETVPDDLPDRENPPDVAYPVARLERDWQYQDAAETNISLVANTTADTSARDRLGRDISQIPVSDAWRARHQSARRAFLAAFRTNCPSFVYVKHQVMGNSIIHSTDDLTDNTWQEWRTIPDQFTKAQLCRATINPDGTVAHEVLLDRPRGLIRDPAVSLDARTVVFSMRENRETDNYHLYSLDLATRVLRQLTFDGRLGELKIPASDTEPTFAADGSIIFQSTRCGQTTDCWPITVSNLYRCDADGGHLRRLAYDEVSTFYPQLLEDGRILYSRWEYNDRTSGSAFGLMVMNDDGTYQTGFALNSSTLPTSMIHARGVPGTGRVMFIDCGHHCGQKGKLVEVDPALTDDYSDWTFDDDRALWGVTPNTTFRRRWCGSNDVHIVNWRPARNPAATVPFMSGLFNLAGSAANGAPGRSPFPMPRFYKAAAIQEYSQIGPQWAYPFPLGEGRFLVSFMPEGDRFYRGPYSSRFGIYAMDESGRRELLAFDWGNHCMSPVALVPRRMARRREPSATDWSNPWGTYFVQNVYEGAAAKGLTPGCVKRLRVVAIGYRAAHLGWNGQYRQIMSPTDGKIGTPISVGNGTYDVKHVLGEVDVEKDGSCLFEVPARTPVYFQLVDAEGCVAQTMRSWTTLRPGERNGCIGCHERRTDAAPAGERPLALKRAPQKLRPFVPGAAHPLLAELERDGALASLENFMGVNRPEDVSGDPTKNRGFSFTRMIQPILDRKCVACHGADEKRIPVASDDHATVLDFRSLPGRLPPSDDNSHRRYTRSYLALSCRGEDNDRVNFAHGLDHVLFSPPYTYGAAKSAYWRMLRAGHPDAKERPRVALTPDELKTLACWIDLGVPFCGGYTELHDWNDWYRQRYLYFQNKRIYFAGEELNDIRRERKLNSVPLTGFVPGIAVPRRQRSWSE